MTDETPAVGASAHRDMAKRRRMVRSGLIKWFLISLLAVVPLALIARGGAQILTAWQRPHIDKNQGVNELFQARIGGIPQWLHARGTDRSKPVLLWIHGGPGTPMMPFSHIFQNGLEKDFIVVQWDQRNAGKTYFANDPAAIAPTMTFDRMEADAVEVIDFVRRRYGKRKVALIGHSWGSMLGLEVASKRPDLVSVYIGTGQVIDTVENERRGYALTLREALRRRDRSALAALRSIAPYPEADGRLPSDKTSRLRDVQHTYRVGISRAHPDITRYMLTKALQSPEYSLRDVSFFLKDTDTPRLSAELAKFDARRLPRSFKVPIVMLLGRYDFQVPSELAASYLASIAAPQRRLVWLEASAHSPMVDQPSAFDAAVVRLAGPIAVRADAAFP